MDETKSSNLLSFMNRIDAKMNESENKITEIRKQLEQRSGSVDSSMQDYGVKIRNIELKANLSLAAISNEIKPQIKTFENFKNLLPIYHHMIKAIPENRITFLTRAIFKRTCGELRITSSDAHSLTLKYENNIDCFYIIRNDHSFLTECWNSNFNTEDKFDYVIMSDFTRILIFTGTNGTIPKHKALVFNEPIIYLYFHTDGQGVEQNIVYHCNSD
ncbi:hypothetical protein B4U79_17993 [Dinothrombium tinctorium]|uniref:Uncharacterized protein n=1 Tax=Dinothrombium tinctorium TaxID=1965070 RepID=A0A3S3P0B1_9ACAR|nr:hypothetical protein B4U79_17993 [Dinothrombium tinctorium]